MSNKKIKGITKVFITVKKIRFTGFYEDGTEFQFSFDRDRKENKHVFDKADEFVKSFYAELEG